MTMNSEDRKERIRILRRKDDRKTRLPNMLIELSKITKSQFSENEVLTIEQIDIHKIHVQYSNFNSCYLNIHFPIEKASELSKTLNTLSDELSKKNYLILSDFSDIAVLNVNTNFIVDKFEEIIQLDKNSLTLYNHIYQNGLCIDLFEEYCYFDNETKKSFVYELRIFGKDWIKLIAEKL